MTVQIGINGFGRIGRTVLRIALDQPERFAVRGLNLRRADTAYMAYLMRYDSIFGRFNGSIEAEPDALLVNGKRINVFSQSDVSLIPWNDSGAEYIIESTGAFNTTALASGHLNHGAKKVVLTAPPKDAETPTFVMGINQEQYDPEYNVVSNASCTTNCLAPLAKVVHDNFGIVQGLMSTIHSATSKQKPVDARAGRDWRTGRSVINNIIPSSTGAAKAVGQVIPELNGKLTGMSFRVPTSNVSVVDLTVELDKGASYEEICAEMKAQSEGALKGILGYTEEMVVGTDFRGDARTSVFDVHAGIQMDDTFVKLVAWYDNEWGYSNKCLEMARVVAG